MIAFFRDLCTKDLGLKLLSLALSILIYSTVKIFEIGNGPPLPPSLDAPTDTRTLAAIPVLPVSSAADVHAFKVNPPEVAVTVRGDPRILARLESGEIRAFVDLTGIESVRDLRQRIEVSVPAGITPLGVVPAEVHVVPPKR